MSGLSCTVVNKAEIDKILSTSLPDSVRYAIANTCNRVVFFGMEKSEEQIRDDFILRGGYVVGKSPGKGAIKYEKAIPHHDIAKISATWGSVDKMGNRDYSFMEGQEEGFTNEKKPVPSAATTRGGSNAAKVARIHYLKNANIRKPTGFFTGLVGSTRRMVMLNLIRAYQEGFGKLGSRDFFSFDDGEYAPGWTGGLFQFGQDIHLGESMYHPDLIRMYFNPGGRNGDKSRKAKHWMEKSQGKIKQTDIDTFYEQEFNTQLARNIKNMF